MRLIAVAAAGLLLATASLVQASPLQPGSPEVSRAPLHHVQQKKEETAMEKVKRTWRSWTTPSHSFCVRCPIPVPLTSKTCVAKGKTVDDARSTCIQQNPLCYVSAGKC